MMLDPLDVLAGQSPAGPVRTAEQPYSGPSVDLARFIEDAGIPLRGEPVSQDGGLSYRFDVCPKCGSKGGNASVIQFASGALAASCFESDCGFDWDWLKATHLDAYATRRPSRQQRRHEARRNGTAPPPDVDTGAPADVALYAASLGKAPDLDLAIRFVQREGERIRYCAHCTAWYVWDSTRWRRDTTGRVQQLIKAAITTELEQAIARDDGALAKALIGARQAQRISAVETLARTERQIAVEHDVFDRSSWLLNTPLCTVDLRTGKTYPHRPADMLTKLTGAPFVAGAQSDLWDRVIRDATGGDIEDAAEYRAWLQRAFGYGCTGDTSEEVLFFLYGPTGTGKSTILEAVLTALGDYATVLDFEVLLVHKAAGGPRDSIAALVGSRFVKSVEVSDGRTMAEGLVKWLTGGDRLKARQLYEKEFEFDVTFKLFLAANSTPKLRHDDEAVWRRIRRCPFKYAPARPDKTIKARLKDPADAGKAVVAWLVAGCLEWQRVGLGSCRAVDASTKEYRAKSDTLAGYLTELTFKDELPFISRKAVWTHYAEWASANNADTVTATQLYDRLRAERATDAKSGVLGFKGVSLTASVLGNGQARVPNSESFLTRPRVDEFTETATQAYPTTQIEIDAPGWGAPDAAPGDRLLPADAGYACPEHPAAIVERIADGWDCTICWGDALPAVQATESEGPA